MSHWSHAITDIPDVNDEDFVEGVQQAAKPSSLALPSTNQIDLTIILTPISSWSATD